MWDSTCHVYFDTHTWQKQRPLLHEWYALYCLRPGYWQEQWCWQSRTWFQFACFPHRHWKSEVCIVDGGLLVPWKSLAISNWNNHARIHQEWSVPAYSIQMKRQKILRWEVHRTEKAYHRCNKREKRYFFYVKEKMGSSNISRSDWAFTHSLSSGCDRLYNATDGADAALVL